MIAARVTAAATASLAVFLAAPPVSSAEGWLTPTDLGPGGRVGAPVSAVAPDGRAAVAWTRVIGGEARVEVAEHLSGGSWTSQELVTPVGVSAADPRIAIDSVGRVIVVYELTDGGIGAVAKDPGGTWTAPLPVSATGADPDVAAGSGGEIAVAWTDGESIRVVMGHSDGTSTAPAVVAYDEASDGVSVAVGGDGTAHVGWVSYSDGTAWVGSGTSSGFDSTDQLSDEPVGNVDMSARADGTAVAVWGETGGGSSTIESADYVPGNGWNPSGPLTEASVTGAFVAVATAPNDAATFAWVSSDTAVAALVTGPDAEPVEQLSDNGDGWNPELAMSDNGTAVVAWGSNGAVRAVVRETGGDWTEPARLTPGVGGVPHVGIDASGNPLAVWSAGSHQNIKTQASFYELPVPAPDPGPGPGPGTTPPLGAEQPGPTAPGGAPPPAVNVDRSGPMLSIRVSKSKLATVLKRGLTLRLGCNEACSVNTRLARRGKTIARASGKRTRSGTLALRLRFTAKARKQLKRARSVSLTLVVEAVDTAGNKSRKSAAVALRR